MSPRSRHSAAWQRRQQQEPRGPRRPLASIAVAAIVIFFLASTLPVAFERPTGGRSGERQGQTAGMIRIFCENPKNQDPRWSPVAGPQVHYGHQVFNLELPIFEWLQGRAARALSGPECDSVEAVAKTFNVIASALAIAGVALLGTFLWGSAAGVIGALLLATNGLWMRYATYSMLDNRMLACAVFAIYFSVRRRALAAFALWALTITQKPQAFAFLSVFWAALELVTLAREKKSWSTFLVERARRRTLIAFLAAVAAGYAYYRWSCIVNAESDLPWVLWMGPRSRGWFFGDWADRLRFAFYKGLTLDWLKKSQLNVAVPIALGLAAASPMFRAALRAHRTLQTMFLVSLPLLVGRFFYTFVFYNVFVVHEYYSLPLNVGAAIIGGAVLGALWDLIPRLTRKETGAITASKTRHALTFALACVLGYGAFSGAREYFTFTREIGNPSDWRYLTEWNHRIFPEERSFVVMAGPVSGRDILFLYLTKQRGFAWCYQNEEFAPRAFWKNQGVRYVAWWKRYDPATKRNRWTVRSIDEELAHARARGWSSDISDAWAGRSMHEWSDLAGRAGHDPCGSAGDFDPRTWK